MDDIMTYKMHIQLANVQTITITQPVLKEHSGSFWKAGEMKIRFGDGSVAILPFATDHYKKEEDVPELLVGCVETDVAEKIQMMQAKLSVIAETVREF